MAYKSKFTGAVVDELLETVQTWKANPSSRISDLTEKDILDRLTGQGIIDKINTVTGNIKFTKFVEASSGAGTSNS